MKKINKTEDYWVCERCGINSLDDVDRMIPCPRGSCDAEIKGVVTTTIKVVLNNIIKQITEDEFYENYKLIDNHIDDNAAYDGKMFETYGDEFDFVIAMAKQNRVISIIDGDDEEGIWAYYTSGFHKVNVMGYFVTTEPFTEEFEATLYNE